MCGIAGFAGLRLAKEHAGERLRAMCNAIRHRGPDSDGFLLTDTVGLGMRRLSIIDVSGGTQPISNEDGSVTVVFNGELYNHHELRRDLEARGHKFSTHSDTEVLVHLYEERGFEMAAPLRGMFAFAIWDERRQCLFLARDRTGIKPLSYARRQDGIIFCSELRSLYTFDQSALRISSASVMQYLAFGYVPDPSSIFDGVNKLPPGHSLVWRANGGIEIRRYWSPPLPDSKYRNEADIVEEIRQRLDNAVRTHLESEVPLGAFLSGGLDSSAVVALMCRHASGRVRTFSIGFAEKEYDESEAAQAVATHFDTDHVSLIVRPDVETIFESIATMFDEPFADSSAIPTLLVAQLARRNVTVALSGDGGDELFGGYTRYQDTLRRAKTLVPASGLWKALGLMLPHGFPGRNRLLDLGRSIVGRYAATVLQPVRIDEGGVASGAHPYARLRIEEQLRGHFPAESVRDFAAAMMRADLETYLPGDILTKVDRTSMAVSLEARVPLLDSDLVDFAMGLPGHLRVTTTEGKRLFRRALKGIVPDFVLTRPKQGFQIPLARWFQGPLNHRITALQRQSGALQPYVDTKAVERLVAEHTVGRRDHSALLWRLIVLDNWLEGNSDGRLGRSPAVPEVTWNTVGRHLSLNGSTSDSFNQPPAVSGLFLASESDRPTVRVGILVDGEVPAYARGIIRDLVSSNFTQVEVVAVAHPVRVQQVKPPGIILKAYEAYVESRFPAEPDPLSTATFADILAGIPRVELSANDSDSKREIDSAGVAAINALNLDVLLDFGRRPPRGSSLPTPKFGVWRYHFGDRALYPEGSCFFRELVDGRALSGIELLRLASAAAGDTTISAAQFSTAPFPSRKANRFAPIWGARHFVIQALWELHQASRKVPTKAVPRVSKAVSRVPTDIEITVWLFKRAGRRMNYLRRRRNGPVAWRIAVRKTTVPLFEDSSIDALSSFRWLRNPPGHYWADPVIFEKDDEAWLFFEDIVESSRLGRISCGRLLDDGSIAEVRPVMHRPHHVSFPQVLKWDSEIFMLPETAQGGGLDLYRARNFPNDWVLEGRLLNFRCVDSSIFRAEDSWWLVTSPQVAPGHAPITWLLQADKLTGPWRYRLGGDVARHAGNARGGGAVFEWGGRLIRPSQDCSTAYGRALLFNEVLSLTGAQYDERIIGRVDAKWMPGLAAVHSYSLSNQWEAIDGGFFNSDLRF